MTDQTCDWVGASGKKYTYYIWPRHPKIDANQDGNYIYSKLNSDGKWVPVYIGQGDLSVRTTDDHHKTDCIDKKGATHIHMHKNAKKEDRLAEESDLLARYTNAKTPNGCNG